MENTVKYHYSPNSNQVMVNCQKQFVISRVCGCLVLTLVATLLRSIIVQQNVSSPTKVMSD